MSSVGRRDAGSDRAEFARSLKEDTFGELLEATLFEQNGVTFARFHDHGIKPPFDLGYIDELTDLETAKALIEGFVVAASEGSGYGGRYALYKDMKYKLGGFLQGRSITGPEAFDTDLISEFDDWLTERYAGKRRQKAAGINVVRRLIDAWRRMPAWQDRVCSEIAFPPQRKDRRSPTVTTDPSLSEADYEKLWSVAARKSRRIIALHERRKIALEKWEGRQIELLDMKRSPIALAAYLSRTYADEIPPPYTKISGRYLGRRIKVRDWQRARGILMPSVDEFIPAIIILTLIFALNPSTIQGFRHKRDYRREEVLGRERLFIMPVKRRAKGKKQRNSIVCTEDGDNPSRILRYVEERTAFLRARSEPPHTELLFQWITKDGLRSFAGSDFTFRTALAKFAKRHKLEGLQLKKLRPTTLDAIHKITGGDLLQVRDHANHESIQTTFVDYRTDAIARRDEEKLGRAMMQNERYLATGGVIRSFLVDPKLDRGSATPGYACLDPLDSPIPGEVKGRLCAAYGRCPICPLAAVQPTPSGYAYLLKFLDKIDEAFTSELVSGPEWIGRWAIVKKSVLLHLLMFDDETVLAGERQPTPELPAIE
ncbi:MAG: hypothetical protein JKZ02_04355 [Erythrobacter sp.]|nr:hypothetical protein [Verrucomicrobiales bacterium]MBL4717674.1 hypothetical protein [Erythrobacter sp.]